MKCLVDMNLPPALCPILEAEGWDTVHWSAVGDPRETDTRIMAWAERHDRVVLTHDLDFGAILAATRANQEEICPRARLSRATRRDADPAYLGDAQRNRLAGAR